MRIGFDAKRVFHNFRGLGNYSRTLIESLVKYYPDNEYYLYTPSIKDERALQWLKRFDNLVIKTPKGLFNKKFSSVWRSLLLSSDLKKDQLDIFHGLSHEVPPGVSSIGGKTFVTIHDLIFLRFPEFFPWIDRQVYKRKFLHAVRNVDLVIAICEQTKIDLIHFLDVPEEKIRICYQSCHPDFYSKVENEIKEKVKFKFSLPDNYILYVGALEERKNALGVVRAFSRLKNKFSHDLILVGRGRDYVKKIEREVLKCGLNDRVLILNNVSNEELPSFYQMASLFVYPSFFEGWGVPNVEGLFSETPVITSAGGCFPESAGPNSLYINPESVEDIAEKIELVLSDDNVSKEMILNGRKYAESFHWKKTSESLIKIYQSLM